MADAPHPHVLVVDDDAATRDIAARILDHFGYRVTALPVPPAPAEVERLAPDAVALDYWFGHEPLAAPFLEALRARPATARLPVLLVSAAVAAVEDDERSLALADGVLAKPYGLAALRDAVAGCLATTTQGSYHID